VGFREGGQGDRGVGEEGGVEGGSGDGVSGGRSRALAPTAAAATGEELEAAAEEQDLSEHPADNDNLSQFTSVELDALEASAGGGAVGEADGEDAGPASGSDTAAVASADTATATAVVSGDGVNDDSNVGAMQQDDRPNGDMRRGRLESNDVNEGRVKKLVLDLCLEVEFCMAITATHYNTIQNTATR